MPAPADAPFDEKVFVAQMKFNEEMHKAGVLIASEGLSASAAGAHVVFKNGKSDVKDGPFTETKELIGGFYVLEVKSKDEAIAWARRYPGGMGNDDVMEIRPLTGADDIPAEFMKLIEKAAPTWSESFKKSS
ncbi:dehydrogenase [Corallococcus llansteffanensis]|uniref:Dehydrogenase n=1 Tax=Corallococcus llansteffanensis TaxID=2316731 RepID=A0A3A8MY60_9BACT|nr:YciI family protein [Corallococcus llansteffanensis]RKH37188.1 dehydrogenase [Corallococcus llansteffanensis]